MTLWYIKSFVCYTASCFLTFIDFVNLPPNHSLDSLHRLVAENGGTSSMNLNNTVTHCIAAESKGLSLSLPLIFVDFSSMEKTLPVRIILFIYLSFNCTTGIKFQAAKLRGDIIHYSWLFDCCSQKKLLPLKPKLVVHPKLSFPLHSKYISRKWD